MTKEIDIYLNPSKTMLYVALPQYKQTSAFTKRETARLIEKLPNLFRRMKE